jgi:hypothetical protein
MLKMIDLSDCSEVECLSQGVQGNLILFDYDVVLFLELLNHKRKKIPKSERILIYPYLE